MKSVVGQVGHVCILVLPLCIETLQVPNTGIPFNYGTFYYSIGIFPLFSFVSKLLVSFIKDPILHAFDFITSSP